MWRLSLDEAKDREWLEKHGVNLKALYDAGQRQAVLTLEGMNKKPSQRNSVAKKDPPKENKPSKYKNKQTLDENGTKFASKHELEVWQNLQLLEKAHLISSLKRQVRLKFEYNNIIIWRTVPDFYFEVPGDGRVIPIYADAKSTFTENTRTFQTSQRMFMAFYGYPQVVFKKGDDLTQKINEHLSLYS